MKEPLNLVVSNGVDGLKVQKMGLSCGEARLFFSAICARPPDDVSEVILFEKLKATKRRKFAEDKTAPLPVENPWQAAVEKVKARVVRKGR
jgi:hypothetical protein